MSKFFKIKKASNNFEDAFENDLIFDDENNVAWFPGYEEYKFEIEQDYNKMKEKALQVWNKINASLKKKAEDIVPDKYRTILINAIDEDLVNPKQIAKDLAHYISEEDCENFCKIYEIKDISELE